MKKYNSEFNIGKNRIAIDEPTYFIADIAANHDGDINRAKDLIFLAKEAGADVAKFQHFLADKIVSDYGFKNLDNSKMSHQSTWKKSVAEIYDDYHTKREWNEELIKTCLEADIEFMTTPYDIEAMTEIIDNVNAIKIGSGDITFKNILKSVATYNKPLLLATGASDIYDVISAVEVCTSINKNICVMQCNTNYTGSDENFDYVNLNVLKTFSTLFPNMPLGLSDHTHGHSAVLGSIALGARVIEKHFTDDNSRIGPDHHFAMNPISWKEMVVRSRELEASLGDGVKRIEDNEIDTVVIQRRSIRVNKNIAKGELLTSNDLECLRPCPNDAINPMNIDNVIGKKVSKQLSKGDYISTSNLVDE